MSEKNASVAQTPRSKELDAAIASYVARCKLLMKDAFQRNLDDRRAFRAWIEKKFADSQDPIVLLHEDPFYMVCRYVGIPPTEVHFSIEERATRIARDHGW